MRPKSASHRDSRLVFRVYALEKRVIEIAAKKTGMSVSDYIRQCCLHQEIHARLSQQEIELYRLLVEYRNNFSRISNLIKERKDFSSELQTVIKSIDEHLKKFIP